MHHSFTFEMLPVEAFSDVVSFLEYYDLCGLKLTNKLLFAVANKCADAIRLYDFSDLEFHVHDDFIDVYPLDLSPAFIWGYPNSALVCRHQLTNENKFAEFISEAFRNCTIGRLRLMTRRRIVRNAIRAVANTITVADFQFVHGLNDDMQQLIELIDSFRRVQV